MLIITADPWSHAAPLPEERSRCPCVFLRWRGSLNVVRETPRKSRNNYRHDPEYDTLLLLSISPRNELSIVRTRLIDAIEVEQKIAKADEAGEQRFRNRRKG